LNDQFDKFFKEITKKGFRVSRTDKKIFGERLIAKWSRHIPYTDEKILVYHFSRKEPSIKDFVGFVKDFEKFRKGANANVAGGYFVAYGSHNKDMDSILRNYKDEEVRNLINIKWLTKEESRAKKQTVKEKAITVRRKIPKAVRLRVWDKYFGRKPSGKCYVCGLPIQFFEFDVGHNKAVAKGGSDNIDNLRPICRVCNGAMGTMSIQDYKRKYYGKGRD
jgi:5-methylcytosine-specific restriction endonuclease McrA